MNYKISVILPVYNGEKYLEQCLDSIVNQTLKEIEIICINDGSTDNTADILAAYEKKDPRIRVVYQENAGAGTARNNGLKLASGEYLSFLDADDFFEPDMLERAYLRAKEGNAQMVVFGSDQYREDMDTFLEVPWTIRKNALPPYRPMNHRTFTENVFKVFVGWAWDKLFLREFVLEHGLRFQEQRTSNDMLFVFSATVLAERIEVEEKILAHQRRDNPASLSNTREQSWDCFYRALLALRENLRSFGLFRELEQDFVNYALHFSLWNLDTMKGEKQEILYHKLKSGWFRELGISMYKEAWFYNKKEYRKYQMIRKNSFRRYKESLMIP